ncbi:HpcH/HpaI aldolase family protein [Salimicrobium flavidum]|uniref:4-hydroxy-2-oxoheptanedioate aldolase n=1 Tax=Salimicrobium flavidum TaxID=570947 RepID=A0A1N7KQZ9_9BACI|nr:aldolase/citrate lyase family protein [Salimicrobium flavidum]SIS63984.1 4-hydroxy-2-oxoheptanedioate aldolase [Salimicrobium flavidum]
MIKQNPVKKKIKHNETAIGTFVKMTDPSSVEIVGLAGFDFIVIDTEHVGLNKETVAHLIRTAELYDVVPIMRVKKNEDTEILQALDSGALGVQVPNVVTLSDARHVVNSTKYAPLGNRGFAPSHRAAGYGTMDNKDYVRMSNEETLIVCHCESKEAIEQLDTILKEEEIDVVFIGPMDLSQSFDVIGEGDHPKVKAAINEIIQKVKAHGKAVGTVAPNAEAAKEFIEAGVTYVTISSDQGMISAFGRQHIQQLNGLLNA